MGPSSSSAEVQELTGFTLRLSHDLHNQGPAFTSGLRVAALTDSAVAIAFAANA
jgi:hypothetical protein